MRFLALLCLLLLSCRDGAAAQQARGTRNPRASRPGAQQPGPPGPTGRPTQAGPTAKPPGAGPGAGAADRAQPRLLFDGSRAWAHLHTQVAYGPRVPGTAGHRVCRRYLEQQLLALCDTAEKQEFSVEVNGTELAMVNLIGRFRPAEPRRILLCAHWDSRPTADYNPPGQRNQPIDGANDGASGVAILLELARVLGEQPPPIGVDIVLFDGEDYGPELDMMLLGSKYFAAHLTDSQAKAYNYGVLLDMVGDAQLDIHPESSSEAVAGRVYAAALAVARDQGYHGFKASGAIEITDDHTPLIQRGLRVYDFIDFDYPYWHTTEDTENKCRADSLEQVGRVLEVLVRDFSQLYAP